MEIQSTRHCFTIKDSIKPSTFTTHLGQFLRSSFWAVAKVNGWTTEKKETSFALSLRAKTAELIINIPKGKMGTLQLLEETN